LKADLLIGDIFRDADSTSITPDILSRAKTRVDIGNPPGKQGSMGDAINWEAILENDEMIFEDSNIISIDRDFASPLDENELNAFLKIEYEKRRHGNVHLFRSLVLFLKDNVPEIVLSMPNEERSIAVENLVCSGSFAMTHSAIFELKKFTDFTISEVERLLDAAATNSQVGRITEDPDVDECN
jgi:hypothetical protein